MIDDRKVLCVKLYNGLHQRIIKRVDTSAPGTGSSGTLDQQHQFYYTAGWQIAEELVDENWSEMGPASIDKMFKYVWGVRYIDDIILRRRREAEMFGAGEETWYHLTDHQFSTGRVTFRLYIRCRPQVASGTVQAF